MYFEKNFWLQLFESLIEFSNDMKEMTTLAKAKRKNHFHLYLYHVFSLVMECTRVFRFRASCHDWCFVKGHDYL